MATDDHEIGHPHMRREQRHLGLGTCRHLVGQRIDAQKAVSLREGRDRPRTLAGGIGDHEVHEVGAAQHAKHREVIGGSLQVEAMDRDAEIDDALHPLVEHRIAAADQFGGAPTVPSPASGGG